LQQEIEKLAERKKDRPAARRETAARRRPKGEKAPEAASSKPSKEATDRPPVRQAVRVEATWASARKSAEKAEELRRLVSQKNDS